MNPSFEKGPETREALLKMQQQAEADLERFKRQLIDNCIDVDATAEINSWIIECESNIESIRAKLSTFTDTNSILEVPPSTNDDTWHDRHQSRPPSEFTPTQNGRDTLKRLRKMVGGG